MMGLFVDCVGGDPRIGFGETTIWRSGFLCDWRGKRDLCQVHYTQRTGRDIRQTASGRQAA